MQAVNGIRNKAVEATNPINYQHHSDYPLFPSELKSLPNWVVWRLETRTNGRKERKATKIPYDAKSGQKAKSNDFSTWSNFNVACTVAFQQSLPGIKTQGYNGIGYVFSPSDNYLGTDIDHCRNPETGEIKPWAQDKINRLNSYTEISPSGTGVHIYMKARLPGTGRRKGNLEFYDQGRYFTVTGHHLEGTPLKIHDRQAEIDALCQELFEEQPLDNPIENTTTTPSFDPSLTPLDIFELTRRAQNDNKFQTLYAGNTAGYPSHSEADLAFCCKLAFYTQGDFNNIDKFFRISGLFRPKWDEKHGQRTYGDMTIMKALQVQREYYNPTPTPEKTTTVTPEISEKLPEKSTEQTPTYTLSPMGNAERFMEHSGDDVRYCTTFNAWYLWNGKYWEKDQRSGIEKLAKLTVRQIYIEAGHEEDDRERKALVRHALKSEENKKIKDLIEQVSWNDGMSITVDDLDAYPWLFNLKNGTLNLKTNTFHAHQRQDLLTHYVDIPYNPKATCPLWLKFLHKIMKGNQPLIDFLQRAIGYSLTSETTEQCLFFLYGSGGNGKTTFIETALDKLMGQYGKRITTEALLLKRHPSNANNDIAGLKDARVAISSEISQSRRLNEGLVKDLTGEDTISARFLYSEPFDFKPTAKLWIYGNHKPIITGNDEGIWRRIKLIPFKVHITDKEKIDGLKAKLWQELPGILQWAIQGCQLWQQDGLKTPQDVIEATQNYRREMDNIELFLEECCVMQPESKVTAKELYETYTKWCEKQGEEILSQKRLGERLAKRGFERRKHVPIRHSWGWLGIGLLMT